MSVEYHGWAVVRSGLDDEALDSDVEAVVRRRIAELKGCVHEVDGRYINGEFFLWTCGLSNHRGHDIESIMALFSFLAEAAQGSYGLLHVRDDEDEAMSNTFQVFVLARGRLLRNDDTHLSPCVPKIESM